MVNVLSCFTFSLKSFILPTCKWLFEQVSVPCDRNMYRLWCCNHSGGNFCIIYTFFIPQNLSQLAAYNTTSHDSAYFHWIKILTLHFKSIFYKDLLFCPHNTFLAEYLPFAQTETKTCAGSTFKCIFSSNPDILILLYEQINKKYCWINHCWK